VTIFRVYRISTRSKIEVVHDEILQDLEGSGGGGGSSISSSSSK
jgi:hypothetical protein